MYGAALVPRSLQLKSFPNHIISLHKATTQTNSLPKPTTQTDYPNSLPKLTTQTHYPNPLPKLTTQTHYTISLHKLATKTHYTNSLHKLATQTSLPKLTTQNTPYPKQNEACDGAADYDNN